jgi:uncharacterized delta-60 repeat protein
MSQKTNQTMKQFLSNVKLFGVILSFVLISKTGNSQIPGAIDPTFGNNGVLSFKMNSEPLTSIYIIDKFRFSDGKILFMYDRSFYDTITQNSYDTLFLTKLLTDGTNDLSFGINGTIRLADNPNRILVTQDGKILTHFMRDGEVYLRRLLSNGMTDSSFGGNGTLSTGMFIYPSASVLLTDGSLLICGSAFSNRKTVVVKFGPDGYRDFSFGNDGMVWFSFDSTSSQYPRSIMVQGNKVIISGTLYGNAVNSTIARLHMDGRLDSSFSKDGLTIIGFTGMYTSKVLITGDDKLLIGGFYYTNNGQNYTSLMVRLKSNGNQDSTFGSNGIKIMNLGGMNASFSDMCLQTDGKVVALLAAENAVGLVRLTLTGGFDTNFGTAGKSILTIPGATGTQANGIWLLDDLKLLVSAFVQVNANEVDLDLIRIYTGLNLSLPQVTKEDLISVYPNPVNDELTISFPVMVSGMVQMTIYDMNGRLVREGLKEQNFTSGFHQTSVPLVGSLTKGSYVLVVQTANGNYHTRFIKE